MVVLCQIVLRLDTSLQHFVKHVAMSKFCMQICPVSVGIIRRFAKLSKMAILGLYNFCVVMKTFWDLIKGQQTWQAWKVNALLKMFMLWNLRWCFLDVSPHIRTATKSAWIHTDMLWRAYYSFNFLYPQNFQNRIPYLYINW